MFDHLIPAASLSEFMPAEDPSTQLAAQLLSPPAEILPPTPMQTLYEQAEVYNHELPFTPQAKRRILSNMLFTEAFNAEKSAERVKAIEMLGKTEDVKLFAPEHRIVEHKGIDELRERIAEKLGNLFDGEIEDMEVIE